MVFDWDAGKTTGSHAYSVEQQESITLQVREWMEGENKARKWITFVEKQPQKSHDLQMSKANAIYVLMSMRQSFYKEKFFREGYTDVVAMALEDAVGQKGRALMDYLFEAYAKQGDIMRPIYEKRMGVPFSENRFYSPVRFLKNNKVKENELNQIVGQLNGLSIGRVDGFLSVRQQHKQVLYTSYNALELFWEHMAMTDNWIHAQDIVQDYKAVIGDVNVANKLAVNLGSLDYDRLLGLIAELEYGGAKKVDEYAKAMEFLNQSLNAKAITVLAGNIASLVKQSTSLFNGLHGCDLSTLEWAKAMAEVLSGNSVVNWQEMYRTDIFQARNRAWDNAVYKGAKLEMGGKFGWAEKIAHFSMDNMGRVDGQFNALSFAAVYQHYYKKGIKEGRTEEEAKSYASEKTNIGMYKASQPVTWLQKGKLHNQLGPLNNSNFLFLSESLSKVGIVFSHLKGKRYKLALRSYILSGFVNAVMGYLVQRFIRGGEEEEEWESYLPTIIFGPLTGVPILGEMLIGVVNLV